jgi:hypothetical protein
MRPPQRLKPNPFTTTYVRPEGRTLQKTTSGAKARRISILYGPTKSRALIQSMSFSQAVKPVPTRRHIFFCGLSLPWGVGPVVLPTKGGSRLQ